MKSDSNPCTETATKGPIKSDILNRTLAKLAKLNQKGRVFTTALCLYLVGIICYVLWSHLENQVTFTILTMVFTPAATTYSIYVIVRWNIELWHLFDARFLPIRLNKTHRHEKRMAAREHFQNFVLSSEHPVWTFSGCLFLVNIMTYSMAREEIIDFPVPVEVDFIMCIIATIPFTSLSLDLSRITKEFHQSPSLIGGVSTIHTRTNKSQ